MRQQTPEHIKWLRNVANGQASSNLVKEASRRAIKGLLPAITGQDTRALNVFAAALVLYTYADSKGIEHAKSAMREAVFAMQNSTRPLAKKLIPWALDWNYEQRVWDELFPPKEETKLAEVQSSGPDHDDYSFGYNWNKK